MVELHTQVPMFRMVSSTSMSGPLQFKYGLFKCSTLNGSWQGQGLVSQAPNLPTAELLWLGPPALCTAAASTTAAST